MLNNTIVYHTKIMTRLGFVLDHDMAPRSCFFFQNIAHANSFLAAQYEAAWDMNAEPSRFQM